MPEKRGGVGVRVSCDDCYFRQELLCALQLDSVCPTFRATVGRARRPAAPRQAPLIPVPHVMGVAGGAGPRVEPVGQETPMRAVAVAAPPAPFASAAPESSFSIVESRSAEPAVLVREVVQRAELPRAAAAAMPSVVASVHVAVAEDGAAQQAALPLLAGSTARLGRVAQRIAQRYPNVQATSGH